MADQIKIDRFYIASDDLAKLRDGRYSGVATFLTKTECPGKVPLFVTQAAAPAVPAVDALPRFEPHEQMVGFMQDSGAGEYVRLGDVLALLATLSTVPDEQQKQSQPSCNAALRAAPAGQHEASTPAYDLMDGLSKFVELAICELFDGKANKAIRSDLRRLAKDFRPAYWQVARIDAATGAARGRHACNKEASDLAHPADAGAVAVGGDAIAKSKRILALVDDFVERPTRDNRTALRCALMDEFEATSERKPLTDAESADLYERATSYPLADDDVAGVRAFVQAIEQHHGIHGGGK